MKPLPQSDTVLRNSFAEDTVKIRYARSDEHPYGTVGKLRTVRWSEVFAQTMDAMVTDLAFLMEQSPRFGRLTSIVLAGAWHDKWKTEKDHKVCQHCQGRAIDIDSVWWEVDGKSDGDGLIMSQALDDPVRYLAVESVVRCHLGNVLNYRYFDNRHKDHIHADDATEHVWRPRDSNGSPCSRGLYLQAALQDVHNESIDSIDGAWQEQTAVGLLSVFSQAGRDYGVSSNAPPRRRGVAMLERGGYIDFCKLTAVVAMGLTSVEMAGPVISLLL